MLLGNVGYPSVNEHRRFHIIKHHDHQWLTHQYSRWFSSTQSVTVTPEGMPKKKIAHWTGKMIQSTVGIFRGQRRFSIYPIHIGWVVGAIETTWKHQILRCFNLMSFNLSQRWVKFCWADLNHLRSNLEPPKSKHPPISMILHGFGEWSNKNNWSNRTASGHGIWGDDCHIYIYVMYIYIYVYVSSGWWFGTWMDYFSIHLGMSSSQLTSMFFRGVGIPPTSYMCVYYIYIYTIINSIYIHHYNPYIYNIYHMYIYVYIYIDYYRLLPLWQWRRLRLRKLEAMAENVRQFLLMDRSQRWWMFHANSVSLPEGNPHIIPR